jgi:hypothetical protein
VDRDDFTPRHHIDVALHIKPAMVPRLGSSIRISYAEMLGKSDQTYDGSSEYRLKHAPRPLPSAVWSASAPFLPIEVRVVPSVLVRHAPQTSNIL